MRVFIIQSGTNGVSNDLEYSIISKRQVDLLISSGIEVQVGLIPNRTSLCAIIRSIIKLKVMADGFKPDLIHSHYGSVIGFVATQIASNRYPLIISYCGDDLLGTPIDNIIWRLREYISIRISKFNSTKATFIITKSQNLYNVLSSQSKRKTAIIPNGVDINFFKPHENRSEVRTSLGWMSDQFIVLFNSSSGTNKAVKNLSLAFEAVEILRGLKVNASIEEVGTLNETDLQRKMAACDCLLLTSFHEGSPNIVKEALSCNLPIVSVNCGDIRKRLENTNIGGVCDYDAVQLAHLMKDVSDTDEIFNGRDELIRQGLDSHTIIQSIIKVYKKII